MLRGENKMNRLFKFTAEPFQTFHIKYRTLSFIIYNDYVLVQDDILIIHIKVQGGDYGS